MRCRGVQAATADQLVHGLGIVDGERHGPNALAVLSQVFADGVAKRPLATGADDVQRHIGDLEPGVARTAVAAQPVGLAAQQLAVAFDGAVQVVHGKGDVI